MKRIWRYLDQARFDFASSAALTASCASFASLSAFAVAATVKAAAVALCLSWGYRVDAA